MNVLIVNDDGIEARGIRELAKALSQDADVYICAPDGQRSGKSQGITIVDHVYVTPVEVPHAVSAMKITGTPADCTKIGLQFYQEEGIEMDMVFSGINLGSNLGVDTLYSGTVGSAMEAAVSGYPACAVSVGGHHPEHFKAACDQARWALSKKNEIPKDSMFNINVPDLPEEEIRGIKLTRLGHRNFRDGFALQKDGGYRLTGSEQDFSKADTEIDVAAFSQGYVSITPVRFDRTDYSWLNILNLE